jgi:restriction system protein
MTYLDAAYAILQAAGEPLHYEEITQRALDQNLIAPQGLTPAATMGSRLYTDTKQEGSRFVRAGRGQFGLTQWQPKGIEARAQEINQATRTRLAELLQSMPAERFESLIGELLLSMGFDENSVTVTKRSADGGIDVLGTYRAAGLTDVNAAVQVKRWKHNVQAPTVTQLRGSLQVHQHGIIITSGSFSAGARKEANAPGKTHIGLIDGGELLDLLVKHRVGVAERTLTVIGLDDEFWGELAGEESVEETTSAGSPDDQASVPAAKTRAESKKPTGFTLLGQSYSVDSWRGVLLGVCEALAQEHGNAFAPAAFGVRGKKRQYVAPSPDGMINPAQIPGTELWVEANQSATSVQRVVERLLVALGHNPGEFAVIVEK